MNAKERADLELLRGELQGILRQPNARLAAQKRLTQITAALLTPAPAGFAEARKRERQAAAIASAPAQYTHAWQGIKNHGGARMTESYLLFPCPDCKETKGFWQEPTPSKGVFILTCKNCGHKIPRLTRIEVDIATGKGAYILDKKGITNDK